jgi:hypothetical protein
MEKGHAEIVLALFRAIAFLQTLDSTKYNLPNPNLMAFPENKNSFVRI